MPKVSLPQANKAVCLHRGIHPKWIGREGEWAVCNMSQPYLANCIRLLQRTIEEAYPALANRHKTKPLTITELLQMEDQLGLLLNEWRRRFGNSNAR